MGPQYVLSPSHCEGRATSDRLHHTTAQCSCLWPGGHTCHVRPAVRSKKGKNAPTVRLRSAGCTQATRRRWWLETVAGNFERPQNRPRPPSPSPFPAGCTAGRETNKESKRAQLGSGDRCKALQGAETRDLRLVASLKGHAYTGCPCRPTASLPTCIDIVTTIMTQGNPVSVSEQILLHLFHQGLSSVRVLSRGVTV